MKRISAPWRMEYLLKAKEPGCFLCDGFESDQDDEHLVLYRGKHAAIMMNRYPYNNGHLMAAPYRHVSTLGELDEHERLELMDLLTISVNVLGQWCSPEGFNVGLNLGEAAGAGLKDHLHVHVVPRWHGDTNFMPVLGETKVLPQSLDETWSQLSGLFEKHQR